MDPRVEALLRDLQRMLMARTHPSVNDLRDANLRITNLLREMAS